MHPDSLTLSIFDGTSRSVTFADGDAAAAALQAGRAELDCSAIEKGLLPHGATFVSAAAVPTTDQLHVIRGAAAGDDAAPLDLIRLRFSLSIIADRSEYIDVARDATARTRDPVAAERYDRLLHRSRD